LKEYKPFYYKKYADFERDILNKKIPVKYFYPWAEKMVNEIIIQDIANPTDYN
jgi:hypothetical protein